MPLMNPTPMQENLSSYSSNRYLSYLKALISAWDGLLQVAVDIHLQQENGNGSQFAFNGIAVSNDYIQSLWNNNEFNNSDIVRSARDEFHQKRAQISHTFSAEEMAQFPLEICQQTQRFSVLERELLVLLFALEIDNRYEKIFAFINDNVNRPFVTLQSVSLLLNLLYDTSDSLPELMHSPLLREELVLIGGGEAVLTQPTVAEKLSLQSDLYRFLMYGQQLPIELHGSANFTSVEALSPLHEQNEEIHAISAYLRQHPEALTEATYIDLRGDAQMQKGVEAGAIIRCIDKNSIEVKSHILIDDSIDVRNTIKQLQRIANLTDSVLFFRDFEILDRNNNAQHTIMQALSSDPSLILFDCNSERSAWFRTHAKSYFKINSGQLTYTELTNLWAQELLPLGFGLDLAKELAVRFRFTAEQISTICSRYRNALVVENPTIFEEKRDLMRRECSDFTLTDLDSFAQKIAPRYTWDDIVLPGTQKAQLQEIQNMVRYREQVFEQWGYGEKLFSTVGVKALFYGEPGTGKTMSVNVLGKELGLDIFRIDLSQIVSKYVGETEKNLEKVFNEAAKTDAILFFDEADAVFGKRTEVKDAHDKHANVETGYLLQKIEEYDGLVILATNLKSNLDKAFIRRFQFIIKFDMPGEAERSILWKKMFPEKVPCSPDIDFDFLCKGVKLSGAHIKNIALNAAFLAAHEQKNIEMRHVVRSIRKEYNKLGKMITRDELGHYLEMN